MSMDTGHPTHPLFKSMRKGMGRLVGLGGLGARADNATAHGYSGNADWGASSGLSAFSSSTKSGYFLAFLASVAGEADPEGFRATSLRRVARSTDVERVRVVAKVG